MSAKQAVLTILGLMHTAVAAAPAAGAPTHRLFIVNGAVQKVSNRCVGGDAGAFPLVAGLESAVGEVSSLDLKCAVSRSISVPSAWTRMCSAGLPCSAGIAMVDISSGRRPQVPGG